MEYDQKNATREATKCMLARQLLAGRALADFNHAATANGNKSLANCTRCIQAVTLRVFLQKYLQDKKRWTKHFLKKPRDMPVQDYIAQVVKINDYLAEFPPTIVGRNITRLRDDKLLDLLEFEIPIKWQRQMQVQNFEPTARTLRDFQDFCERLESALDKPVMDNKSNKTSGQENGNKKCCCNNNNKDKNISACCMKRNLHTAPNSAVP